jgi:hypothetical protein
MTELHKQQACLDQEVLHHSALCSAPRKALYYSSHEYSYPAVASLLCSDITQSCLAGTKALGHRSTVQSGVPSTTLASTAVTFKAVKLQESSMRLEESKASDNTALNDLDDILGGMLRVPWRSLSVKELTALQLPLQLIVPLQLKQALVSSCIDGRSHFKWCDLNREETFAGGGTLQDDLAEMQKAFKRRR